MSQSPDAFPHKYMVPQGSMVLLVLDTPALWYRLKWLRCSLVWSAQTTASLPLYMLPCVIPVSVRSTGRTSGFGLPVSGHGLAVFSLSLVNACAHLFLRSTYAFHRPEVTMITFPVELSTLFPWLLRSILVCHIPEIPYILL